MAARATWADPDSTLVNLWLDEHSMRPGLQPDDPGVIDFLAAGGVISDYEPPDPPPTPDQIDIDMLNRLMSEQGTITRALAEAQFTLLNEVRALQGKSPLTAQQYKTHLKGLMRD